MKYLISLLIIICSSFVHSQLTTFPWSNVAGYGGAGANRTYTITVSGVTMSATIVNSENVWQDASPAWFPTGSTNPGGGCSGISATNQGMLLSTDWSTNTVKTITTTITFSTPVQGPAHFYLYDINDDGSGSWEDKIIVTSTNSVAAPVNVFKVGTACVQTGGSVTGSGTPTLTFNSGISSACTCWGNNEINVGTAADCISTITIVYKSNTTPTNYNNPKQYVVVSNLTATIIAPSVAPTGITGTTSICAGQSTTLTATGGNASSQWFTGSCGGTAAGTGTSITVSPLVPTTYYVANQGTCGVLTSCVSQLVNVASPPNAGTDGSTTACESSASAIDLFGLIGGEQAGGTWSQTAGSGGTFNAGAGTFTPAVGATTSTFQYLINGVAPCANDLSVATITIVTAPNAGTNGTVSICSNGTPINLFSSLGGSPAATGTWSGGLTGGNLGTYDPALLASGTYTYTVTAAGCANATATVIVTENVAANAGTDGSTTACESSASAIDLFSLIGGEQAGGTWSQTAGSGGTFNSGSGTFTPAVGATTSTFQYLINGVAPCANDLSVVTITIVTAPNAGTNGSASICVTGSPLNLFSSLGGSPAATGSWSGGLTGGNLGTYDPATFAPGVYTYTVTGVAPCVNTTATVTVTENAAPVAGTNGTISFCSSSSSSNLFASLGGTPQSTGTWSGPSVLTGGNLGTYDPLLMIPGVYTYTVVGVAPCVNATATVTVSENAALNAGTNGSSLFCSNGAPANLFASLGGTPDAIGSWSGPSVLTGGNLGTYNPVTMTPGVYTYTVTGVAPCVNATATVTVTENVTPTFSVTGGAAYCQGDFVNDIQVALTGTSNWTISYTLDGLAQTATGSTSPISLGNAPGIYVITNIADANCTNSTTGSQIITINALPIAPIAGTDANYCLSDVVVPMTVNGLGGTFVWYSDAALTNVIGSSNTQLPTTTIGNTTYYVTESNFGCEGPASIVNITFISCDTIVIVIPSAFTPSGDNTNNYWQLPNIDQKYPNNKVFIYNRWGGLLFESTTGDYFNNQWDGKFKNESLPVGSYYYILYTDYEISNEVLKGIVSIIKD